MEKSGLNAGLTYEGDIRLEGRHIKKGMIKVFVESLPIPNVVGRSSNELSGINSIEDIVSLIDLKVVGAEGLGNPNHLLKLTNDPFATVTFGLHHFKTATVPDTNSPIWNQICPLWISSQHTSTVQTRWVHAMHSY